MRVTTQMTNKVAEQTKIAVNQNTLLNSNEKSSGNTLLDALNKTSGQEKNTIARSSYEKTAKNAEALLNALDAFFETGEDSLLNNLNDADAKSKAAAQLGTLVDKYNATLNSLKSTGSELDAYYAQMMKELVSDNKEALAAIGISIDSNAKLSFDSKKFKEADAEKISGVLGGKSDFMQKLAFITEHIADNANANVKSLSTQYNAAGSAYAALGGNLFDSLG